MTALRSPWYFRGSGAPGSPCCSLLSALRQASPSSFFCVGLSDDMPPDCLVCDRARHLPEEARECLHHYAGRWKPRTFGGWAGFIVALLGACWVDGHVVGLRKAREQELNRTTGEWT